MEIKYSEKINKLPPYLFAEIDRLKEETRARGLDIISLGIGDPDLPTDDIIIKSLNEASFQIDNHHYPSYTGLLSFREKIAEWFRKRYNVNFNPEDEILSVIGSKEAIGHLPFAFINRDDVVLIPDPAYPVYRSGTIFAEGIPYFMPLKKENNFFPDFDDIPGGIRNKAKLMFLNYPNNPTSAIATKEFFSEAVKFAEKYNIIIAHDAAYNELYFDNEKPISFFEVEGAKELGIEFHSFSKTFNMTGWRIGFAVGNREIVGGLGKIKSNFDSGVFQAIQYAAMTALDNYYDLVKKNHIIYQHRRDIVANYLDELGWNYLKPKATFYMWIDTLPNYGSKKMAMKLLEEQGIVVTPGVGFGKSGEGFIRMALTVDEAKIKEVFDRIKKINW